MPWQLCVGPYHLWVQSFARLWSRQSAVNTPSCHRFVAWSQQPNKWIAEIDLGLMTITSTSQSTWEPHISVLNKPLKSIVQVRVCNKSSKVVCICDKMCVRSHVSKLLRAHSPESSQVQIIQELYKVICKNWKAPIMGSPNAFCWP